MCYFLHVTWEEEVGNEPDSIYIIPSFGKFEYKSLREQAFYPLTLVLIQSVSYATMKENK